MEENNIKVYLKWVPWQLRGNSRLFQAAPDPIARLSKWIQPGHMAGHGNDLAILSNIINIQCSLFMCVYFCLNNDKTVPSSQLHHMDMHHPPFLDHGP